MKINKSSCYFTNIHVKILAKNVIFKKNEIHYKSFYNLKASITMFNDFLLIGLISN
jgi:hypothetical protein